MIWEKAFSDDPFTIERWIGERNDVIFEISRRHVPSGEVVELLIGPRDHKRDHIISRHGPDLAEFVCALKSAF